MDYFLANNSECSSGCESGWTSYLENSSLSPFNNGNGFVGEKFGLNDEEKRTEEAEEEEDLSMVSDASSGPPHFPEEGDYNSDNTRCFYHAPIEATLCKESGKNKKLKENHRRKVNDEPSLLDDTASSPVFSLQNTYFTLNKNQASGETVLDFSQGYSTTHFEENSAYQDQYGFFHSSLSGNYLQENQWFGGRRWQQ